MSEVTRLYPTSAFAIDFPDIIDFPDSSLNFQTPLLVFSLNEQKHKVWAFIFINGVLRDHFGYRIVLICRFIFLSLAYVYFD